MTIMDAAGSQRAQDDQVQEMIEDGCNVLCINLADRTDFVAYYKCCNGE